MPDLFNGKSRSRSASSVRQARSQESVPSAPQPTSRFQMGALLSGILVPPFHPVRRPGNTPLERTRRFIICCSAARDCCNALLVRFLPRLWPWATTAPFCFLSMACRTLPGGGGCNPTCKPPVHPATMGRGSRWTDSLFPVNWSPDPAVVVAALG